MKFFNFVNQPTYWFFRWVTESDDVDVDDLITSAMNGVETNSDYEWIQDVSIAARDNLTETLESLFQSMLNHHIKLDLPLPPLDECDAQDDDMSTDGEGLVTLLICHAVSQVYCGVVATAILTRAGKWNPDLSLPELIKPPVDPDPSEKSEDEENNP